MLNLHNCGHSDIFIDFKTEQFIKNYMVRVDVHQILQILRLVIQFEQILVKTVRYLNVIDSLIPDF